MPPAAAAPPYETADVRWPTVDRRERVRALVLLAIGPLLAGYVAIAASLALTAALAPGARFSTLGVLIAAGPAWLAAYHVPVSIAGHELGVLPLLPTILVLALLARAAAGAADRMDARTPRAARSILIVAGGTHAIAGTLLAALCSRAALSC